MMPTLLPTLVRASLEGALLAAIVWTVVRAIPRLSPGTRTLLWWCVAAKFVVALLWRAPIGVPVLPAVAEPVTINTVTNTAAVAQPQDSAAAARTLSETRAPTPAIPWPAVLLGAWGIGLAVSLARTLRSWQETRLVVARSIPGSEALHRVVRELSLTMGLRRTADVRLSAEIESPLITGVRTPTILVPATLFPLLAPEQQRMALCHELAHMKRGDLWLGCVPALVERCFFFHPLARLAAREYAFWREAACDEAVLTTLGASPQSYGRLLLSLGVSRQPATFAAAGAAWSFSNLKRRITMLSHPSSPSFGGRVLAAVAVALAIVAIVPVKAVARSAPPAEAIHVGSQFDLGVTTPAPAITPTNAPSESSSAKPADQSPALAVAHSQAGPAPVDSPAPSPASTVASTVLASDQGAPDTTTQDRSQQEELHFVYFGGDNNTTVNGSSRDMSRARQYQRRGERMLWFERNGREYIVRDAIVLRDVEDLWEPLGRIGAEQGKIGAKQGAIGAEQGRYGAKQGKIGAEQGVVGAKQGVVAARLGLLAARESQGVSASERREIDREREELERDMRALSREMEALGRQMRDQSPPMRDLGDEMSTLGSQMAEFGRQMESASRKANSGMRSLMERAIRSGAAQEVR